MTKYTELFAALQQTHPEDLQLIAQYVRWVKLRRLINFAFYKNIAHWVSPSIKVHWIHSCHPK